MEDFVRQKLVELVHTHGHSVIEDHRRCKGLLRDYAGVYTREVNLLVMALQADIPKEIYHQVTQLQSISEDQPASKRVLPSNVVLSRLTQRMIDNLSINAEASRWAVESWALAFGYIAFHDSNSDNPVQSPQKIDKQSVMGSAKQPVLIVASSGVGSYKHIGEAVMAASAGARIIIKPGIYHETLILDKPVEIIGEGLLEEIVIENKTCIKQICDQARIQNVTLQGSLLLEKGKSELSDCHVVEELIVKGKNTYLMASKCVINFINAPEGNLYIEECVVHNSSLPVSSDVKVTKSSLTSITFSDSSFSPQSKYNYTDTTKYNTQFDNCDIGSLIITKGNPHFLNCAFIAESLFMYSQPHYSSIVKITGEGSGLFQECEFRGHEHTPSIFILGSGNPIFRKCKIHNSIGSGTVGIYFGEDTEGVVEDCEILLSGVGLEIARGSQPTIRTSAITRNSEYGIFVHDHGSAIVEDCDLTNNAKGAFKIGSNSFVVKKNIKE